jgi:CRISPR-associated protein Cas5d
MPIHSIAVKVSGDFALFTRPEAKVERVSYPLPTPSAARNILDSICWRPEMRWIIDSISVLNPIRYISVRRNEVQSKISPSAVKSWMADPSKYEPLAAGAGKDTEGTPRNSILLSDVAYLIHAHPVVFEAKADNTPMKYVAMLQRRVEKGQCFQRPSLGCREFAANFSLPGPNDQPLDQTEDLGRMLYDIVFRPDGNRAVFFDAKISRGVMDTRPESVLGNQSNREELLQCSYKR